MSVQIIAPAANDVLVGKTDIEVSVSSPSGAAILKVELYADDRLITTLLDPPWKFTWDAGDSLKARNLRARAYAADGTTGSDRVTTLALRGAQRTVVNLVEVYATVRDQQGRFLDSLSKEDFTVSEAGKPQEIAVFASERKPVRLVLLLDVSGSMVQDQRLEVAKEAAAGFVEAMEPADTAGLVIFSDAPRLVREPSSDKKALQADLAGLEAKGGTALYDAVIAGVDMLKEHEGRKAIVLLSDGRDESADGMGPGSLRTYAEALDAVLKAEVAVYVIGTGENLAEEYDFEHRNTLGSILDSFASRSGGRAYFIKKASRLKDAYKEIEDTLRHQYTLAYYQPPEPAERAKGDNGWRPIEVKVTRLKAKVTARAGYFAR